MRVLRSCAALFVLLAVPLSLAAKPKEQVFDATPNRVYSAVQKVIRDHYVVTFTDDKQMLVSFRTPPTNTSAMEGSASVEAVSGKGKLRVNLQALKNALTYGKGGRIENSIIKWVGEELEKGN